MKYKPFHFLLLISLIAYGGLVGVAWRFGSLRGTAVGWTIGLYAVTFGCFVGILLLGEKRPLPLRWLWSAALLFRALLLFTTPTLSDDVYRYMWDGHVANRGVSPYAHAIESPQLDSLDHPVRVQANNTWMASPYLPVAQWLFAALVFLFPLHPLPFQVAMVLADLGTALFLADLLKIGNFPAHRVALYLLNPLVMVEVAHGAHVDAWMNVLFVGAVWVGVRCQACPEQRRRISAIRGWKILEVGLLGLATLTKGLPGLALLVWFWRWRWWQLFLYAVVLFVLLLPAGVRAGWGLMGPQDGEGLFGALRIYAAQWQFNGAIYPWLVEMFGWLGVEAAVQWANGLTAVAIPITFLTGWLAARRVQGWIGAMRLTAALFIAYLLLSPTFHPWYALMVTALLPFISPSSDENTQDGWLIVAAWLYLNGALILSYLAYQDPNAFTELAWVRGVEWLPTVGILLVALGRYVRGKIIPA